MLAEAGDPIKWFFNSGVTQLGDKLGPILWQFAPTKKFDAADFGAFLALLPEKLDGRKLRHVVEVRHDSFCTPEFIALVRKFNTPVVFAEHHKYPAIADAVGDFVYARLQKGDELHPHRLSGEAARCLGRVRPPLGQGRRARRPTAGRLHKSGQESAARRLHLLHPRSQGRAPAAAMALIERSVNNATSSRRTNVIPAKAGTQCTDQRGFVLHAASARRHGPR